MANYDNDPISVKAVQHAINAAGYQPPLVEDGIYGPKTHDGVIWFQRLHHITQDGIIGDETMAATLAPGPGNPQPLVPPVHTLPKTGLEGIGGLHLGIKQETPMAAPQSPPTVVAFRVPKGGLQGLGAPPPAPADTQLLNLHAPAKKVTWPTWLGAVVGAIGGTLLGGPPVGTALGLAVGGLGGAGASSMINKKHHDTMHGSMFGVEHEIGMGEPMDDPSFSIVAGDIGVPTKMHRVKG